MQIIKDGLSDESLQFMKRMMEREELTPEQKAQQLDRSIRAKREAQAEADDRNRHERRKAAALARAAGVPVMEVGGDG